MTVAATLLFEGLLQALDRPGWARPGRQRPLPSRCAHMVLVGGGFFGWIQVKVSSSLTALLVKSFPTVHCLNERIKLLKLPLSILHNLCVLLIDFPLPQKNE